MCVSAVRLDALTSRLDKRVQIENRVVGAIVLSSTDDAASQEAVVGSAIGRGGDVTNLSPFWEGTARK